MIRTIIYPELEVCDSTQEEAKKKRLEFENRAAVSDEIALHWVCSKAQNKGRGRQGSLWLNSTDPNAQLLTSVSFNSQSVETLGSLLSLVAGHILWKTVRKFNSDASNVFLKWPNDLYMICARTSVPKKLAGILSERQKSSVTIGFGINLNWSPTLENKTCGSLKEVLNNKMTSKIDFLTALTKEFESFIKAQETQSITQAQIIKDLQNESMKVFFELNQIETSGKVVKPLKLLPDGELEAILISDQSLITIR